MTQCWRIILSLVILMGISHIKTVTIADGTNTNVVIPSDWNSAHAYTLQDAVSLSGNTSGALANISSGTLYLAGGNNITLSQNANSVTVSGPHTSQFLTTAMASNRGSDFVQATAAFAGTSASGTIASDGISVSIGPYLTTAMLSNAATISNIRLSAGTTSNLASAFTFADGNNISFGLNAGTITASVDAAGGGLTNIRVSAGTTSNLLSAFTLADSNGLSFGLNASTITGTYYRPVVSNAIANVGSATNSGTNTSRFAADDHIHAGVGGFGASNTGNTAGNTGTSFGTWVLAGTTNITVSESTGAAGVHTLWLSAPNAGVGGGATLSFWQNMEPGTPAFNRTTLNITGAERTFMFQPLEADFKPFPGGMTVNTMLMPMNLSGSTATMSAVYSSSFSFGFYTLNAGTLTLVNSCSTSFGAAGAATNLSTLYAGSRWLTVGTAAWSSSPVFSAGVQYWWGWAFRSSNRLNQTFSVFGQNIWASNSTFAGTIGAASVANATTKGIAPFYGNYSATSNAVPGSIGSDQLNKQVATAVFVPQLVFNNITASF